MSAYKPIRCTCLSSISQLARLGSHQFHGEEEELVAQALDRLGYRWHYETHTIIIQDGNCVQSATADFWIEDGEVRGGGFFIEVKQNENIGGARRHKHQRSVALRAGFSFAYVICRPGSSKRLLRRLRQAVRKAKKHGRRARKQQSTWEVTVRVTRNVQFVPVVAVAG